MRKNKWVFLSDGGEDVSLCVSTSLTSSKVSEDRAILKDVSVISLGEAKGHGFIIDQIMLDQILELGTAGEKAGSVKVHLEHPSLFGGAPRSTMYLGELVNFRAGEGRVISDLKFSEAAKKSPQGNLVDFVLARVAEKEENFGLSVLLKKGKIRKLSESVNGINLSFDVAKFGGADVVEDPAANTNMFFSSDPSVLADIEVLKTENALLKAKIEEDNKNKNIELETKKKKEKELNMDLTKQILALCANLGFGVEKAQEYIESGKSLEEIMLSIKKEDLVALGDNNARNPKTDVEIQVLSSEIDKMSPVIEDAILFQQGVLDRDEIKSDIEKTDLGSISLHSLARRAFQMNNETSLALSTPEQMWTALNGASGQGSSTLLNILSNVLNKSASKGYTAQEATFEKWVGKGQLKDFKTNDIVSMTGFSDFDDLKPGQSPSMGVIGDYKEQARLKSVGKALSFDRRAFIDDDMNQLAKAPKKIMMALKRKQNRDCYNKLTSASFAGPTLLQNSLPVFHTTNGNIAASDGSITEASLDLGIKYFKHITSASAADNTENDYINIRPAYMLLTPEEEMAYFKLTQSTFYNTDSTALAGSMIKNYFGPGGQIRGMTPISEVYLEDIDATKKYPWYMIANPQLAETLVFYTLAGSSGPFTISGAMPMGQARGFMWVVEHDYNFEFVDYRGIYRNKGKS